jgi:hypothetical protein
MAMPEAAMHKDHRIVSGQDYVRLARQILAVKSETKAHRMQKTSDANLGLGVLRANRGHVTAALFTCVNINHQTSPALACFSRIVPMNRPAPFEPI